VPLSRTMIYRSLSFGYSDGLLLSSGSFFSPPRTKPAVFSIGTRIGGARRNFRASYSSRAVSDGPSFFSLFKFFVKFILRSFLAFFRPLCFSFPFLRTERPFDLRRARQFPYCGLTLPVTVPASVTPSIAFLVFCRADVFPAGPINTLAVFRSARLFSESFRRYDQHQGEPALCCDPPIHSFLITPCPEALVFSRVGLFFVFFLITSPFFLFFLRRDFLFFDFFCLPVQ